MQRSKFKVGNYGTGNAYTRTVHGSSGKKGGNGGASCGSGGGKCCAVFGLICCIASTFYVERNYHNALYSLDDILHNTVTVPWDEGPYSLHESKLVHLEGSRTRVVSTLVDADFGISFPGAVAFRRHVEYCQWQEFQRTNSEVVGTEADT